MVELGLEHANAVAVAISDLVKHILEHASFGTAARNRGVAAILRANYESAAGEWVILSV